MKNLANTLSDPEFQLWLAKQLPEEIDIQGTVLRKAPIFVWRDNLNFVTPCEWDYITRRAEEKLTQEEKQEYFYQLNNAVGLVDHKSPAWIKEFAIVALVTAPWQTRAKALMKVRETMGMNHDPNCINHFSDGSKIFPQRD